MQLLPAAHYYQALLGAIEQSKHHIILAAMVVQGDAKTQPLFAAVVAARKRGVRVQILVDAYYKVSRGKHTTRQQLGDAVAATVSWLSQLRALGAEVWEVGDIGINPAKKRCHIKVAIIDEQVFCFGGINLSQADFEQVDYMLSTKDAPLGGMLEHLVQTIGRKQQIATFEYPINNTTSVLFDAGIPKESIIYEKAVQLASKAQNIYYVSQMPPSGRLATVIRHATYKAYFNRPAQAPFLLAGALAVDTLRYRVKNSYTRPLYLHAKYILFEDYEGQKAVLSGSHNFSWRGVAYGTKEIALYSTDKTLWAQLYDFMQNYVA